MKCSICTHEIDLIGTWDQGHNAEPINNGRCCSTCNATQVIPARLNRLYLDRSSKSARQRRQRQS